MTQINLYETQDFKSKSKQTTNIIPLREPSSQLKSLRHQFTKKVSIALTLTILHSIAVQASSIPGNETLKLSENKRIEASICPDSMNRIAVANDRITQLFGDEGTFESQNDEATGQVFLKPTAENGSKNLSLTLITEQGITQDLTLIPTAKAAKTLILTHDPADQRSSPHNDSDQGFLKDIDRQHNSSPTRNLSEPQLGFANSHPFQEQLLTLLKQAINDGLPTNEEDYPLHEYSSQGGHALTPTKSWQTGPYVVHALMVENITNTPLALLEKDFYQTGDLALSFDTRVLDTPAMNISAPQSRILSPQKEVTLYVVRFRRTI